MDIAISTVSPPAETGTDWLPVAAGAAAAGRGVAAAEWRLGLGLSASIHQQILTTPVQSSDGKFIFLLLRTLSVCAMEEWEQRLEITSQLVDQKNE